MSKDTKPRIPNPEDLKDAIVDLVDTAAELTALYLAIRDKINEVERTASGEALGELFDTSYMVQRAIARLAAAERDIDEVSRIFPSIRNRLVGVVL